MRRTIYDTDHDDFRDSVRGFVGRVLQPRHEQMLADKTIPRDIWKEAGTQGLLGLAIPEQYGGAGADEFRFSTIVAEEISSLSLGIASCFSIHSDVCPPYLVEFGTEEQKRRWLPGMAAGELICGIGMTAVRDHAVRGSCARASVWEADAQTRRSACSSRRLSNRPCRPATERAAIARPRESKTGAAKHTSPRRLS